METFYRPHYLNSIITIININAHKILLHYRKHIYNIYVTLFLRYVKVYIILLYENTLSSIFHIISIKVDKNFNDLKEKKN